MAETLTKVVLGSRYWSIKQITRELIGVPTVLFANPGGLKWSYPNLPHRLEVWHEFITTG